MSIIQHSAGREMCSTHDTNPRRQQVNVSGLPEVVHAYDGKTYYYILVFFLIQNFIWKIRAKKIRIFWEILETGFSSHIWKKRKQEKTLDLDIHTFGSDVGAGAHVLPSTNIIMNPTIK